MREVDPEGTTHRKYLADRDKASPLMTGHVTVLAEVGTLEEAVQAAATTVPGVCLRSESLFPNEGNRPTVAQQSLVYSRVLELFRGRRVLIRTFSSKESLTSGRLEGQFEALVRAQELTGTSMGVMAPMVEAAETSGLVAVARSAGLPRMGAFIEDPLLVLSKLSVLEVLDSVALGGGHAVADPSESSKPRAQRPGSMRAWEPDILEHVLQLAQAGLASGTPVGACGVWAADPLLALVLTGLGITSLSVPLSKVAPVHSALSARTFRECEALAETALTSPDGASARLAVAQGDASGKIRNAHSHVSGRLDTYRRERMS